MSATMLARLVLTTRSERRLSGTRKVGTAFAPVLVSQGLVILPESLLMRNLAGFRLYPPVLDAQHGNDRPFGLVC
jgi:hypothetical protein